MNPDFSQNGARHSDCVALRGFVTQIASDFCPFITSARTHQVLTFSDYSQDELTEYGDGDLVAGLFHVSVVHTERLRKYRTELRDDGVTAAAALICDNITVLGTESLDWRTAKNIVDWPHYLLKVLYSECGIMFGKFWTKEQRTSLDGRAIPLTPTTFLSIRSAVRLRDPALLRAQVDFAKMIRDAVDDGRDVLARRFGISSDNVTFELLRAGNCFKIMKESL